MMKPAERQYFTRFCLNGSFLLLCATITGCGASEEPAAANAKKSARRTPAAVVENTETNPSTPRVSVFTIDRNLRDPFFPNSSKLPPGVEEPESTEPSVDVASVLRQGFQGLMAVGKDRLAVINGVILEAGKRAEIPITANGKQQVLKVRCLSVLPEAVVLEVQGQSRPLTITRKLTQ